MIKIKPTSLWYKSSPFVKVPGHGQLRRAPQLTVTQAVADYLIFVNLAQLIDAPILSETTSQLQPEVFSAEEIEPEEILDDIDAQEIADDQNNDFLLDFLNTASVDEIAETLKGVGPKKAEELTESRPLTREILTSLLSRTQLKGLDEIDVSTLPTAP